jgi:glutathione synthase/RimK-type ligase-like ATP-grasp enzyme
MMEALRSYETSVSTRGTGRHIPKDGILLSRRRENLNFRRENLVIIAKNVNTKIGNMVAMVENISIVTLAVRIIYSEFRKIS